MGQIASRHRPDDPVSVQPDLSSLQSSTTHIADDSSLSRTQQSPDSSSHHNSDLPHHQVPPLPSKRSRRRSFLGSLRSPLRSCLNHEQTPSNEADFNRASNTHKRWAFDRRRRKTSESARTLHEFPELEESQLEGPSRTRITSNPSAPPSSADQKGKANEDKDAPFASATDVPSTALVGPSSSSFPSSGSSTLNVSQSDS